MLEIDSVALLPAARKRHHSEVLLTPSYDVHIGFESVSRAMDDRHVARCRIIGIFSLEWIKMASAGIVNNGKVPGLEISTASAEHGWRW